MLKNKRAFVPNVKMNVKDFSLSRSIKYEINVYFMGTMMFCLKNIRLPFLPG